MEEIEFKEIFKINEELTVVVNDEKITFKRNGLSVSLTNEELETFQKSFEESVKHEMEELKRRMVDHFNGMTGTEL